MILAGQGGYPFTFPNTKSPTVNLSPFGIFLCLLNFIWNIYNIKRWYKKTRWIVNYNNANGEIQNSGWGGFKMAVRIRSFIFNSKIAKEQKWQKSIWSPLIQLLRYGLICDFFLHNVRNFHVLKSKMYFQCHKANTVKLPNFEHASFVEIL